MIYLMVILAFAASILIYSFNPRPDVMQLETRLAEGRVLSFVNQHQAARDYMYQWLKIPIDANEKLNALPENFEDSLALKGVAYEVEDVDDYRRPGKGKFSTVMFHGAAQYLVTYGLLPETWEGEDPKELYKRALATRTRGAPSCGILRVSDDSQGAKIYAIDNGFRDWIPKDSSSTNSTNSTDLKDFLDAVDAVEDPNNPGSSAGFWWADANDDIEDHSALICMTMWSGPYASGITHHFDAINNAGNDWWGGDNLQGHWSDQMWRDLSADLPVGSVVVDDPDKFLRLDDSIGLNFMRDRPAIEFGGKALPMPMKQKGLPVGWTLSMVVSIDKELCNSSDRHVILWGPSEATTEKAFWMGMNSGGGLFAGVGVFDTNGNLTGNGAMGRQLTTDEKKLLCDNGPVVITYKVQNDQNDPSKNTQQIFVNNKMLHQSNDVENPSQNLGDDVRLSVGAYSDVGGFDGMLYNVRYYNRSLEHKDTMRNIAADGRRYNLSIYPEEETTP